MAPVPCPAGTYMNSTLNVGNNTYNGVNYFCTLCPSRYVCTQGGLSAPNGFCGAGHYCSLGASSTLPLCTSPSCAGMYGLCTVGNYCPPGTGTPIPCPDGSYMNSTGASVCRTCPAGYYCSSSLSTSQYYPCPRGYYCPSGTGTNWVVCPSGRYGSRAGLSTVDDCTACPPGLYCAGTALTEPTGNCSAGYFCPQGSQNQFGQVIYAQNNTCPAGFYCPTGSAAPQPCTPGTYNPTTVSARYSSRSYFS